MSDAGKIKGREINGNTYGKQSGMLKKNRCVHFEKFEDNLDDAEFETDAKQIKAEQSMETLVKKTRNAAEQNRCEHFEECEECDDDAMKCKHTELNNNTAEFVSIMEE